MPILLFTLRNKKQTFWVYCKPSSTISFLCITPCIWHSYFDGCINVRIKMPIKIFIEHHKISSLICERPPLPLSFHFHFPLFQNSWLEVDQDNLAHLHLVVLPPQQVLHLLLAVVHHCARLHLHHLLLLFQVICNFPGRSLKINGIQWKPNYKVLCVNQRDKLLGPQMTWVSWLFGKKVLTCCGWLGA